jgi:hypothetical protein
MGRGCDEECTKDTAWWQLGWIYTGAANAATCRGIAVDTVPSSWAFGGFKTTIETTWRDQKRGDVVSINIGLKVWSMNH